MADLIRIVLSLLLLGPRYPSTVQVSGKGPPVVLLHGFGEALDTWNQAGIVRLRSPHFRVIAMDVRGHGGSAKPDGASSYGRELAADVVRHQACLVRQRDEAETREGEFGANFARYPVMEMPTSGRG